jgi:hypothetical protein
MRRRRFLMIVTGGGALAAYGWQSGGHVNFYETPAKGVLVLRADTIVGPCLLPADTYLVACDCSIVTFSLQAARERIVELPCQGKRLKRTAVETSAVLEPQPSGRAALEKLYIKGSNIEHTF